MILTSETKAALYASECSRVFCNVLTIGHPDMETPLKFIDNDQDVSDYNARGFDFTPPAPGAQDEGATVVIDDVDRLLAERFQTIGDEAATASIGLVDVDDPDSMVDGPYRYKVVSFSKSSADGRATLSLQRLASLDCNASRLVYDATAFPGLFG